MFSVPHLIIIFAVALMVFGPEKLPELARTLGKIMGEFRRATGDLRSTFEGHMRELEREAELRSVREAQPPANSIGGGSAPSAAPLPVSTPAVTDDPLPPAPGTVATEKPNSFAARESSAPQQLQFDPSAPPQDSAPAPAAEQVSGDRPNPDPAPEKVSDGRARPA
ncbi:MAG: twin-arginine translocase TatA/TatE family subunit [Candidatus Acidiferrales bacterium]